MVNEKKTRDSAGKFTKEKETPKVDPIFKDLAPVEPPEEEEKQKRKYTKRKPAPVFEDKFFVLLWEQIFNRVFPGQPLSPEESAAIGGQTNAVVSKYLPDILAKYADEFALAFSLAMAIYPRMVEKKRAKEKTEVKIDITNPVNASPVI
jgi:hypothetical protein